MDDVLRLKILRHVAEAGHSLPDGAGDLASHLLEGEYLLITAEESVELASKDDVIERAGRPQMACAFRLGLERRRRVPGRP